jgi:hypothetical protein
MCSRLVRARRPIATKPMPRMFSRITANVVAEFERNVFKFVLGEFNVSNGVYLVALHDIV